MEAQSQVLDLPGETILHRDELKRRLAELKGHRDRLLINYIMRHPEMTYDQVGNQFGLVAEHVSQIARRGGVARKRGRKTKHCLSDPR